MPKTIKDLEETITTKDIQIEKLKEELTNVKEFLDAAHRESATVSYKFDYYNAKIDQLATMIYNMLAQGQASLDLTRGNIDQVVRELKQTKEIN